MSTAGSNVRTTPTGRARIALLQFPGSNCDVDCMDTMARHFGIAVTPVWHSATSLPPVDGVIIPGGFSFGDYLRSGALASHSPVMQAVREFAKMGGAIIGICNGFQILVETQLLPGALLQNVSRKFICQYSSLAVERGDSVYHRALDGMTLRMPIAHGEGRYFASNSDLERLTKDGRILFSYADATGLRTIAANPNGSARNIAGIVSENGRVMGLMPHPERATDLLMGGSADGLEVWRAFLASFT